MPPDVIMDDLFGALFYDPPMGEWRADVVLNETNQIEVTIWWDESTDGPFDPVLERARLAYSTFIYKEESHRQSLAAAMLKRYQRCKPDDEPLPERDLIASGLRARGITFSPNGSATVYYRDDAELFGDHCIFADLDSAGHFIGFTLQG
jgi:hypothetical protein